MRGREFTMKDAYSFDRDQAAAKASYQVMAQAYRRILTASASPTVRWRPTVAPSAAI